MKEKKKISGVGLAIVYYHIFLLLTLPFYFYFDPPGTGMIIATIILYFATGMSITGGYHRLFSHKTYKAHPIVEFLLLYFGTMAAQGSALRWAYEHRIHHAHVDTDKDPYSIKKGFWYAHVTWLMEDQRKIEPGFVKDLLKSKMVVFQDKYYVQLLVLTNLPFFFLLGWLFQDYTGAFFMAIWVRILALHHSTWFINSLAHTWGKQTFSKEHTAVDNFAVSLLTFGEGYHSYHHTFMTDYRNGIKWYQYDPTKWLIWSLSKIGLTRDLRKTDMSTIRKRMVIEDKQRLLDRMKDIVHHHKEVFEQQIHDLSERISSQAAEVQHLLQTYHAQKKEKHSAELKALKLQIKHMQKTIRKEWNHWVALSNQIMRHYKPVTL